jgi:hypothetical protein
MKIRVVFWSYLNLVFCMFSVLFYTLECLRLTASTILTSLTLFCPVLMGTVGHRYQKTKNRLLKFCYVPATSAARNSLLFFLSYLLRLFTVLMKQTRQAVRAIKQSIFLDVYAVATWLSVIASLLFFNTGSCWACLYFQNIIFTLAIERTLTESIEFFAKSDKGSGHFCKQCLKSLAL